MTTTAATLITQGKAAVEAELTRIESDLATAKAKAEADAGNLVTALGAKISAHAAEVSTAQALANRAATVIGTVQPVAAASTTPALTLTSQSVVSQIKSFFVGIGWKGPALTAGGLTLVHYVIHHAL